MSFYLKPVFSRGLFVYSGWPILAPFFDKDPFLHGFCSFEKTKNVFFSRISEEKTMKISDYDFFILVIFLQKREIFSLSLCTFYFSMIFYKQKPTYLEFYRKSVS